MAGAIVFAMSTYSWNCAVVSETIAIFERPSFFANCTSLRTAYLFGGKKLKSYGSCFGSSWIAGGFAVNRISDPSISGCSASTPAV